MTGDNDPTVPDTGGPTPGPAPATTVVVTADGERLEAQWAQPVGDPVATVVLAHPHPAHGGSMASLVTSELFRVLPGRGCAVLRFNFRGVGASTGTHGGGPAERADVTAAVAEASRHSAGVPLVLSGWSFGGDVSLAIDHPAITGWFAVAPTLRILAADDLVAAHDPRPKHLAVPEHDEFNPPAACAAKVAGWTNTELGVVTGADHYLVGRTGVLADRLVAFAERLAAA